jgi:hypothetical protein
MRNIKNKNTILKKHKSKLNNKNNNDSDVSNNDICFSTDNNNNNNNNTNNEYEYECLICLEIKNNNEKTTKLNDLEICEKHCECDGWFHKSCLNSWFIIKFSCPICRNQINSFTPHQINQINNFNHTQTHVQIIQTGSPNKDFFIIIFSIIFVYWFYF